MIWYSVLDLYTPLQIFLNILYHGAWALGAFLGRVGDKKCMRFAHDGTQLQDMDIQKSMEYTTLWYEQFGCVYHFR